MKRNIINILKTIIKILFILPMICYLSPDKYDIDKVQKHMDSFFK